jgi:hypothetical protein
LTLTQWLMAHLGTAIDFDGAYGAQCVDAVNDWLRRSGSGSRATSPTAAGIATERWRGYDWVPNAPHNAPSPGDIVVWHPFTPSVDITQAGHTAVAIWCDRYGLVTADQNWSGRKFLALYCHDYRGVAGWQHRT